MFYGVRTEPSNRFAYLEHKCLVVGARSGFLVWVRTRDVNVQNSEKPLTFARTNAYLFYWDVGLKAAII